MHRLETWSGKPEDRQGEKRAARPGRKWREPDPASEREEMRRMAKNEAEVRLPGKLKRNGRNRSSGS